MHVRHQEQRYISDADVSDFPIGFGFLELFKNAGIGYRLQKMTRHGGIRLVLMQRLQNEHREFGVLHKEGKFFVYELFYFFFETKVWTKHSNHGL